MKNIRLTLLLMVLVSVSFTACQSPTMEQQVEKLLKTDDSKKRSTIAIALADSLDLRAVELIAGLYPNSRYAEQALEDMLTRYAQIIGETISTKSSNSIETALECIGKIPTRNAAICLGEQAMISEKGIVAFNLIKPMSHELKEIALLSGLGSENENESMQDSLLLEFYSLGQNTLFDLLQNPQQISISGLKKVIIALLQDKEISKEKKMEAIICGMKMVNDDDTFQSHLMNVAKQYGDDAMITLINEWYNDRTSKNILNAIISFDNKAIRYLSNQLGKDKNAEELLAHIGKPAVNTLMAKMKSSEQDVRFAAADALVKMTKHNPSAVKNLTDAFDSQSISAISKNYPFYIRMGLSGTEDLLLKALNTNFSTKMCLDYLNCGNWQIESGAKDIAARYGYDVYSAPGTHYGPKWGRGN